MSKGEFITLASNYLGDRVSLALEGWIRDQTINADVIIHPG